VQVVRSGAIAALVSEIDLAHPPGRPEDLRAHQQLLDGAVTATPVLPFRFGAAMTDAQAVAEELLAPHEQEFAARPDGMSESRRDAIDLYRAAHNPEAADGAVRPAPAGGADWRSAAAE
jgi:hypothetical protein